MRVYSFFIVCIFLILPSSLPATVIASPSKTAILSTSELRQKLISLKTRDLQKLIGRKLTLKEKIGLLVLKYTSNKKTQSKKGSTALTFGIAGLVLLILGLFIPYIIIGALIASILAIVLGSNAKRQDSSDAKARTAVLLGWITLGAIALLLILAAVVIATYGIY